MSTLQAQATLFGNKPIPQETIEDIINRVAAMANAEDLALVQRLTVKQVPRHWETAVEITPAGAALILRDHDGANRELRLPKSQGFARMMVRGWPVTMAGIGFDVTGKLCDGQHRLLAIAIHGSPVKFDVCLGEEESARETYDNGSPRSAADMLHMHGVPDGSIRQVMVKNAVGYKQKLNKEAKVPMDRAQIVEQAERNAHALATAIGLARNSLAEREGPEKMVAPEACLNLSTAASIGYLMLLGGWQAGETGSFLNALQVGVGEGESHPIVNGASLLLKDKRAKTKDRLTVNQKIAIALQVNYLWRTNRRQTLRAPKDLVAYTRPADVPPDPMGDGIQLPASPVVQ